MVHAVEARSRQRIGFQRASNVEVGSQFAGANASREWYRKALT